MKTALTLVYLSFIAGLFASITDRYTPLWTALAAAVVVLLVAALLRVHAVVNAPRADE
ncbi:hypothetical protein [Curtobacterium sp. MCBA15_004]|uniref:hypothetical protein n=1 Tax=Curtobacterium sp. MCBA15_004 TaxID=1898733 RepID=UPI0015872FC6|nr:hypothetical protein [Curtobacterium sp. MCBA15_004]WIA96448.1 hypothetical protein QOL16_15320 [Curtobacterium sp. MCBA15_004]